MKVTLILNDGSDPIELDVPRWTTVAEIYEPYKDRSPYRVLLARMNNRNVELTSKVGKNCTLRVLDMRDQAANMTYQGALTLLYLKAVEDELGRTDTEILHTLNQGLYSEIHTEKPVTAEQVAAIEDRMHRMAEQDIPFKKMMMSRGVALKKLDALGMVEKRRLLERAKDAKTVKCYALDGFINFFYGAMVPSTSYVDQFTLRKYGRGVLLRFPQRSDPSRIPPYRDDRLLYHAFAESGRWNELLDIRYVSDLNEKIEQGKMPEIIQLSEALHEKRIVEIANEICEKKKRIILIAGPSSSGKTSFARRLCIQLAVNGRHPLYMGTDDYFLDRVDTPFNEKGERDYESLEALDIGLFNRDMQNLLDGREVDLPTFDFMTGEKVFGRRITKLKRGEPVVIEGIHGLNPILTRMIPEDEKYRIYISPLTSLNIDEHNRVPTTDARMLRRIVRDYSYRGHSAQETIREWTSVRDGEERNIFPFTRTADTFFNSVHIYELAILKKYAQPLLSSIKPEEPEYGEASRILNFLRFFNASDDDDIIVNNSILREFIGGSIFFNH